MQSRGIASALLVLSWAYSRIDGRGVDPRADDSTGYVIEPGLSGSAPDRRIFDGCHDAAAGSIEVMLKNREHTCRLMS